MTDLPDDRDTIRHLLQRDARALAEELAPGGRVSGREYRAPNPFRGEAKNSGSFVIWIAGEAAGGFVEYDAGGEEKGDVFALLIGSPHCPAHDFNSAMAWARERFSLPGVKPGEETPEQATARRAAMEEARAAASRRTAEDREAAAQRDAERTGWARDIWSRAQVLGAKRGGGRDAGWAYLTAPRSAGGRGCDFDTVRAASLRFAPSLQHRSETGEKTRWPAVIAPMLNAADELQAVHRIWVRPVAGGGAPGKAPVDIPKKTLGPPRGAVVRISAGIPGPDGMVEEIFCEGIEDGLHLAAAAPSARVFATIALVGLLHFEPLSERHPPARRRTLVPDNDWAGGPAAHAYAKAARRMAGLGAPMREVRMPVGKDPDDFVNR